MTRGLDGLEQYVAMAREGGLGSVDAVAAVLALAEPLRQSQGVEELEAALELVQGALVVAVERLDNPAEKRIEELEAAGKLTVTLCDWLLNELVRAVGTSTDIKNLRANGRRVRERWTALLGPEARP